MSSSLAAKRIVVTRPIGQEESFLQLLHSRGALPIHCPLIEIASCYRSDELREVLLHASQFDWICFTSVNGVNLVLDFAEQQNLLSELNKSRFACIGPGTEYALNQRGLKASLVPKVYQAEGMLDRFAQEEVAGKKFLLLRAKGARKILEESLLKRGGEVKEFPIYETTPHFEGVELLRALIQKKQVDIVTFTSASTVLAFQKIFLENTTLHKEVRLASIGPITSAQLIQSGFRADIEAKTFTTDGLVTALEEWYKEKCTT